MKIFSWNVNGLRAGIKKGTLQDFIETHRPDILCMGETKISEHQIETEKIREQFPDYTQLYSCSEKKGYAGTAIWVNSQKMQNLTSRAAVEEGPLAPNSSRTAAPAPCKDRRARERALGSNGFDFLNEGRITTLEFTDFYLVSIYVPNSKDDLSRLKIRQDWDQKLYNFLEHLQAKKPVVVCGDMNVAHQPIDLARPKDNEGKHGYTAEERAGFDAYIKHGLIDTFRFLHPDKIQYTWWSHWSNARARNIGWRIDYFLISSKLKSRLKSANIYPEILGSDHCPISIELTP